jgi:hypothetical protein
MKETKLGEERRIPTPYAMKMRLSVVVLGCAGLSLAGCGGASYSYEGSGAYAQSPEPVVAAGSTGADYGPVEPAAGMDMEMAPAADSGGGGFGGGEDYYDQVEEEAPEPASDDSARDDQTRYAQAARQQPQQQTPPATGGQQRNQPPDQATDATSPSGPLLIYTAQLTLAVFEVEQTQDRILESLGELEGFLAHRTNAELVVRVPAARFEQALALIEEAGDVLDRNIEVQDVSEEFRDLQIRIANAEAMRDRLEQLLARANDVEGALAIERELQRLTDFIERAKGRQRFLADRIAFSTITVYFRPLATEPTTGPDGFNLPFDWLGELGLSNLLRL